MLIVRYGLVRQVESARLRLRRELGRTLRCLGPGNLNDWLRNQVQSENSPDGRYRRALQQLGGYPEWKSEEI